ncbi:MAG: carbamoyltransferase HypF [Nitrospirae bacterium]|nr:carbamoyltransferase HypF [Nitrospirota bacterium]
MESLRISVKGIVQGVGFRPFVYNLATGMGLKGSIANTSDGVEIAIEGDRLRFFVERLRDEAPPLSRVLTVDIEFCEPRGYTDFSIIESTDTGSFTLLSPDMFVCGDCLREMNDPNDRRFSYPFINCTNCGPRYSITRSVPYDRPNTTMDAFRMCGRCEAEYHDPSDRRFHAQPNACPDCGPRVSLVDRQGAEIPSKDPLAGAIDLLKEGKILAVKGLGGFHLACDATNAASVSKLRERKRKSNKPFGLMAPDIGAIEKYCHVSDHERALLLSGQRPIVLLLKKEGCGLPAAVSPNNSHVGFMLPYTPLHHLLFGSASGVPSVRHFDALVMTSGNISEEPIVKDNADALEKLSGLADAFVFHDRDIFMRVDDSVMKLRPLHNSKAPSYIRRSRGFVPDPVILPGDGPDVMGCGADMKNTFTLTKGGYAIVSQHIGDMENQETLNFYEETLRNLKAVYRSAPVALAYDLHPGYLSSRWALRQPLRLCGIQHHYAHIASVMAEKGITDKVIGVSFDGNGYGSDGNLWGGEFLIADIAGFRRVGHLSYVPLPGGEMAIREPWRIAVSYLKRAAEADAYGYLESSGLIKRYGREKIENILRISGQRSFSPLSSGAGRLFDAVAALTGICDHNTFEGEAAMALESLASPGIEDDYPVDIHFSDMMEIDFGMTFFMVLKDLEAGVPVSVISSRFHNTVAACVVNVVLKLSAMHNIRKIALSGGVFQNNYLLKRIVEALSAASLKVLINDSVPCNDAGISLGQAYIIRERIKSGIEV